MFKFGTSGIRDLTVNLFKDKVAAKLAKKLSEMGWQAVNIGRDGRTGSDGLADEFTHTFDGTVRDYGVTTTPEMAYLSGLSVMVTASHNPAEYSGFKLYLNGAEQSTAEIAPVPPKTPTENEYWNKAKLLPADIAIDCANGALGYKLNQFGFKNIINFAGEINRGCGATHPENLREYCVKEKRDIGFAVDGDADRLIVFLGGKVLDGDETAFLLATIAGYEKIVIDETMNSELANHFAAVTSKVGGHSVVSSMQKNDIDFGAEKSGHYYFDKNIGSSDALDAIALVSEAYKKLGADGLLTLMEDYRPYFQLNKNLRTDTLSHDYEDTLKSIEFLNARTVIRKSGTEPLLRIMVESKNQADAESAMQVILDKLKL